MLVFKTERAGAETRQPRWLLTARRSPTARQPRAQRSQRAPVTDAAGTGEATSRPALGKEPSGLEVAFFFRRLFSQPFSWSHLEVAAPCSRRSSPRRRGRWQPHSWPRAARQPSGLKETSGSSYTAEAALVGLLPRWGCGQALHCWISAAHLLTPPNPFLQLAPLPVVKPFPSETGTEHPAVP